jgi:hypothetical protein
MNSRNISDHIIENADEVRRLHRRVHETLQHREESSEKRQEWEHACSEFKMNYDRLAFPGGYWTDADNNALNRIRGGDAFTIEAGICFLETRPYFFWSGYMFKDLLRKMKKAPLSEEQAARLQKVVQGVEAWKEAKRNHLYQEGQVS